MDDNISRKAAIAELDHGVWGKEYDKALAKAMLESLPTAQPKKGKWKEQAIENVKAAGIEEVQVAKCSACGLYHTTPYMYYFSNYKFCPNCGAKMVNNDE